MSTPMVIDGHRAEIDYHPEQDRFYAVAEVPGGWVAFHGRSLDELRADFREMHALQRQVLTELDQ